MSFQPSSIRFKEFGTTGAPLAAGRLYTYASGTTTHKAAYTDATLGTPQSYTTDGSGNKYITLDSRGEARVWLGSGAYSFVVTDSDGANSRTVDGVRDQADTAKDYTDTLRSDLASTASATKGSAMIGWLRNAAGAVATTVGEWLSWHDIDPFEFMSSAQRASVIAGNSALDVSAAWQACITAANGKPIRMRGGVHRIDTALTYSTSGESPGLKIKGDGVGKAFFDNRVANGTMLTLDGTGTPSTYALAADLEGFSIITTTSPAASRGIDIKGQWMATLSRGKIKGLSSDGIRIINNNADADATGFLELDKFWVQGCGGWGVNVADPTVSSNASGHIIYKQSYIVQNTLGGLRLLGGQMKLDGGSIANNGGPGLLIPYYATSGAPNLIDVERTEFDGNTGYHIQIQACLGGTIKHAKFVYGANMTGIQIGDGGAGFVQDIHCENNQHRRDAGTVTLHSIGSNAQRTDVMDTYIPSLTGVTPITDAGSYTRYRQVGQTSKNAKSATTSTVSGSYTPNILTAESHRIVINAAGAFTVNAPTGSPGGGEELTLDIYNSSGGAITVTFATGASGAFQGVGGYTDPANGKRRTCGFIYNATDARWVQVGAWSPDL